MSKERRHIVWALIFFVFCLSATISLATVIVNVNPWGAKYGGAPNTTEFPPDKPPADLPKDAVADAKPILEVSTFYNDLWDGKELKITDINVTTNGHTEIREPEDCNSEVHEHELGHDELNKYEYDEQAKKKIERALEGLDKMKFKGEGDTNDARRKDAQAKAKAELKSRIDRAKNSILTQMNIVGSMYDIFTNNGDCNLPNCPDNATGIDLAKKLKKFYWAWVEDILGSAPADPNDKGSYMPSKGPGTVCFYDDQQHLVFNKGEPILITSAGNPLDPILGRGAVLVGPMIRIGPQDNGTVLLSDTILQIIDINNPDINSPGYILMKGFVLEVAYFPSRCPGSVGMIQGYLGIPPEWAGGINNTIDSNFLADMQAASNANEMTTFWFYPDQELFDKNGQSLISETEVQGILTLGVGIPIEFIIVDDFEGYNNTDNKIYDTWADYYVNNTGMTVGYFNPPFAERTNVHSGRQAMYMSYDNNGTVNEGTSYERSGTLLYSEAERQWADPQDWTGHGVHSLTLWFRGVQSNIAEQLYIVLHDSANFHAVVKYSNPAATTLSEWTEWNIPLTNFTGVNLMAIMKMSIGIGDRLNTHPGGSGTLYIDDIRLYRE